MQAQAEEGLRLKAQADLEKLVADEIAEDIEETEAIEAMRAGFEN